MTSAPLTPAASISVSDLLAGLPDSAHKIVAPAAPLPLKMMAAKGLAPLQPNELIFVQAILAFDLALPDVASAAAASLRSYPSAMLKSAIAAQTRPELLSVLARFVCHDASAAEALVLNRHTPDDALASVVPELGASVVELLLQSDERHTRSSALVAALKDHASASRNAVDRMFDTLARAGVIYDGMPEFADAIARLNGDERMAAVAAIEIPPDLLDPSLKPAAPTAAAIAAMPDLDAALSTDESDPDMLAEQEAATEEKLEPLLKRLSTMSTAQKVAVALKGNKEARTALLRDTNKVVAVAAIKNPRITDQEVQMAAASKSANEEVLRIICTNREWTRGYGVRHALILNPKTPLAVSMRFLPLLNANDVKNLAKSKNISSALAAQAKNMLTRKK